MKHVTHYTLAVLLRQRDGPPAPAPRSPLQPTRAIQRLLARVRWRADADRMTRPNTPH